MAIELRNVTYIYARGTPFERKALDDVNLRIDDGEFVAVAGHTGSGKSTLMQHFNGLLRPSSGEVLVDGVGLVAKDKAQKTIAKEAKHKVGMVFQYPEQQLFEETVFDDIAFGVKNQGVAGEDIAARVKEAMAFVNLDYEDFKDKSPFALSGGEMRRVAIAGVIAMRTKYLVLDEPTAGLDPAGRRKMMAAICRLHRKSRNTVILVTHNMDDIAEFADRAVIMAHGKVLLCDKPRQVFAKKDLLAGAGLKPPPITELLMHIKAAGIAVDDSAITLQEGVNELCRYFNGR